MKKSSSLFSACTVKLREFFKKNLYVQFVVKLKFWIILKKKDDKSKEVKIAPATPKPSIVKVPSRTGGITDPRMQKMMERGLEYVSKIDDPEKREAMLERIEKFQRGDYNEDIKEKMKRYEEYKNSRERKK